jgi:hypothetical protein
MKPPSCKHEDNRLTSHALQALLRGRLHANHGAGDECLAVGNSARALLGSVKSIAAKWHYEVCCPLVSPETSKRGGETCPVSTEGWTRRVHFVREAGGGGAALS